MFLSPTFFCFGVGSAPFPLFPRVILSPVLSRAYSGAATLFNLIHKTSRARRSKLKPKLNITLPEEAKRKLAALAQLEKRSVSNLIEVMADATVGGAGPWPGRHRLRQDSCQDRWVKRVKRR
jgi:CopG antitoxin of type II toxin-antitoxin system